MFLYDFLPNPFALFEVAGFDALALHTQKFLQ